MADGEEVDRGPSKSIFDPDSDGDNDGDSEMIKIYRSDSSALNPDEVSRAKELIKAHD